MAQGFRESTSQSPAENWKETRTWAFRSTRVVTTEGVRPAILLVKAGRIFEVAEWGNVPPDAHLRDYGDFVLMPGMVDTHVHINDAGDGDGNRIAWEGFATATQAAAAGGVTTLVDMPLNSVPGTLSPDALEAKRKAAEGKAWVDWVAWGGIVGNGGIGGNEEQLLPLAEAGVAGFKCFLVPSGIDDFAWVDEPQLRVALDKLHGSGLPLLAHAELAGPVEQATALLNSEQRDWRKYATYLASRPDEAELEAIEMLIALAVVFDTPLHVVHLSSAQALPILKKARAAGLKITVETCPQYLWFASEEIPDGATEYKCAPPIRSAANRDALWNGLREGVIDMIATDHSPCEPELKQKETGRFDEAWGGIASLGLALPIVWTGLKHRGRDLESKDLEARDLELLSKWLAQEPARLAGLAGVAGVEGRQGQKGALAIGYDADVVIFDPDEEWTVTEQDLRFRHKLSPYLGAQLRGRVLETYLRGECIFWGRGSDAVMDPVPRGRELRRNA
ncbi:allantoinase AllB [Acidicapsa ligni]|uniref:allantoinase AllB n=1 Tax=Acidicapsa ligni TaxID=542300 RepID=UPI0021E07D6D|nr:allantoinase AllB [Acidicapsa ligni]